LPSIAVSMVGDTIHHYETGALIAKQLVMKLATHRLPSQTILNVNVPDVPIDKIRGLEVTRLGTRHTAAPAVKEWDPRGHPMYWIGPPGLEADAGEGTDFFAVNQGFVSITPLHLDMTHYKLFDQVSEWMGGISLI
jgi:5'-nucleotidase